MMSQIAVAGFRDREMGPRFGPRVQATASLQSQLEAVSVWPWSDRTTGEDFSTIQLSSMIRARSSTNKIVDIETHSPHEPPSTGAYQQKKKKIDDHVTGAVGYKVKDKKRT
jgi:hypothetical protein